jgi:hypothetical protein
MHALDLEAHLFAQVCVEIGQRLVEQQHRRADDDGAGERHALLLAARELGRIAVGEMAHPHGFQHLRRRVS